MVGGSRAGWLEETYPMLQALSGNIFDVKSHLIFSQMPGGFPCSDTTLDELSTCSIEILHISFHFSILVVS